MADPADQDDEAPGTRAAITPAIQRAVQRAIWEHKRLGNPICISRDGQIVWIPPEEIDVEKPQDD